MTEVFGALQPAAISGHSVALFIDGDNLSSDHLDHFLKRAEDRGPLVYKRVFGNSHQVQNWGDRPGLRFIYSGAGKNSSDLLLTIQAVDLAHTGKIDTFVIASSDNDFSHLAHYLRERNFAVVGIGHASPTNGFRAACTEFVELERTACARTPTAFDRRPQTGLNEFDQKIFNLIQQSGNPRGMPIQLLGTKMYSQHDVKISARPEKTWRRYLDGHPQFYNCDPQGPTARVRLKQAQTPN